MALAKGYVSVNVKGDRELNTAISRLRNIAKSLTQIHRLMALEAEAWIKKNFQQEGRLATPAGWKKLSPNTIASRRKGGRGAKILADKGLMRGSINSKYSPRDARAGFGEKKSIWHHGGTKPYVITPKRARLLRFTTAKGTVFARKVNHPGLPARSLIPTREQIVPLVVSRIDKYIHAELTKAGLKVRRT